MEREREGERESTAGTHPDRIAAGAVVRLGPVYTVATMTHYAHLAKQLGVAEVPRPGPRAGGEGAGRGVVVGVWMGKGW